MSPKQVNRGSSLVTHPYRTWYDEQIMNGLPINHIYSKQTEKIPPELHMSKKTIAEYRNNILKPNTEVLRQFKEETVKAENETLHQEIMQEPQMQQAIVQQTAMLIDAEQTFLDMHTSIANQIRILAGIDDPKTRAKVDIAATTGELCDRMRLVTMDYLKLQGQLKDAPQTQINIINIEKSNAEMEALKSAIVDIIKEIDPSILPKFFDLLKKRTEPIIQAYELKQQNALIDTSFSETEAANAVQNFVAQAGQIKPIV